jgi:hypothetical protein
MQQVSNLNSFKEKHILELENYKQKLDGMLRSLSIQLESTDKNMKTYTTKILENSENVLRGEMSLLNIRINDLRIENHKTIIDLDKHCKQISTEYDRIQEIKKDISNEFVISVDNMKNSHKETTDAFEVYKEEFNKIKSRFVDLSEFIKDIRFKKNLQVDVDKKDLRNLSDSLSFRNPHRSQTLKVIKPLSDFDAESEVKKYIRGLKEPKKKFSKVFEHLDEQIDETDNERDMKANTIQLSKDLIINKRVSSMDLKSNNLDSHKSTMQMAANVSRKNTNISKIEIKNDKALEFDDKSYKCNTVEVKSINMMSKIPNLRFGEVKGIKDISNENDFKLDENEGYQEILNDNMINREEDYRDEDDFIDPSPMTKKSEKYNNSLAISHDNFNPKNNLMNLSFKLDKQEFNEREYKYEMSRKIAETEKRLQEIEANAKRKLEELVSQVKVYIPINFNSYIKPQEKQNPIYDNVEQNYYVNVIDANTILQNPTSGFRGDTNKAVFRKKSKAVVQPDPYQRRTQ